MSSLRTSVARCDSTPRAAAVAATAPRPRRDGRPRPRPRRAPSRRARRRRASRCAPAGARESSAARRSRRRPVLAHHREHLLDEERVPGRRDRDPLARARSSGAVDGEPLHELGALVLRRAARAGASVAFSLPPPQSGLHVEQLGARDAEEEDRRVAREIGDVLDEVDEDGLGPLQVVDDDDLRALGRARLEQPSERELRLRRRACR